MRSSGLIQPVLPLELNLSECQMSTYFLGVSGLINRLKYTIFYEVGPMDRVPDLGMDWRLDMQEFLYGMGAGVLNPCDKPTDFAKENFVTRDRINELKRQGSQYLAEDSPTKSNKVAQQIRDIMKPIVNIDLRMVDLAHAIVMYVDTDVHMCGSYNEQTIACLQRKPVLVCCKQGKFEVPNWLFGICDPSMFFGSWKELKNYLKYIDSSPIIDDNNKWRFFDFSKVYNF